MSEDVVARARELLNPPPCAECSADHSSIVRAERQAMLAELVPDLVAEIELYQQSLTNAHHETADEILRANEAERQRDYWRAEADRFSAMLPDLRLWANRGSSIHDRDGDCTCDGNPSTTNGPEEDCPWHGREYSYWVDRSAEVERLRGFIKEIRATGFDGAMKNLRNNPSSAPLSAAHYALMDILAVIDRVGQP